MYDLLKRTMDILVSLLVLTFLFPLFLLISIAILIDSPGPIFYRASRMGRNKIPFTMYKFRSMCVNADKKGKTFITSWNPDITKVGKFLRVSKIDELPQFLNVLFGQMSIVGPRPEIPRVVNEHYTEKQLEVLSVRPGLTCITQVRHFPDLSCKTPPGVNSEDYYYQVLLPEKLQEDLEYIEKSSLWFDFFLIFQTIYVIFAKGIPLAIKNTKTRGELHN